jgi:hypothetical protein
MAFEVIYWSLFGHPMSRIDIGWASKWRAVYGGFATGLTTLDDVRGTNIVAPAWVAGARDISLG